MLEHDIAPVDVAELTERLPKRFERRPWAEGSREG